MPETYFIDTCILLSKNNFGEGHIHLSFITKNNGLIKASAFGGQRISKRYKGQLDYFKVLELRFSVQQSEIKDYTNVADVVAVKHDYFQLTKDIKKYSAASYCLEIINMSTMPYDLAGKSQITFFDYANNILEKIYNADAKNLLSIIFNFTYTLFEDHGFVSANAKSADISLDNLRNLNMMILEKLPKSFSLLDTLKQ